MCKSLLLLPLLVFVATSAADSDPEISVEVGVDGQQSSPMEIKIEMPSSAEFVEHFQDSSWSERWLPGDQAKAGGEVSVEKGMLDYQLDGEVGLQIKSPAQRHAISAALKKAFRIGEEDFVIQYDLRLHKQLECGGAYLKLIADVEGSEFDGTQFNADTPYSVMFGPDRCGATDKVHFIFRHENPITHEIEEKHASNPPQIKNDRFSHVYTLAVYANNTFHMFIDGELQKEGSLFTDMIPPVNPPKTIDDVTDVKPADWVDDAQIPDPDAVKPSDWDEDAPERIPDDSDSKPEGWLDDAPLMVPDPSAQQPEDWDEEADGEWEAPLIDNPDCESFGCGEWKPRMVRNPAFKGKWSAPLIDNPKYKGEWKPKQVPNPDYFEEKDPHNFMPISAIGIEIWTMQDEIEFDNIYLGHNVADALAFAEKTWKPKSEAEHAQFVAEGGQEETAAGGKPQLSKYVELFNTYFESVKENPLPFALAITVGTLTILLMIFRRFSEINDVETKIPMPEERTDENEEEDEEEDEDDKDEDDKDEDETNDKQETPESE